MKHLLNTLFVTTEDIYLSLDGENVVANQDRKELARYPLHTLEGIVSFSYSGASPALMGACAERNVSLAFCTPRGRFLARTTGKSTGNVLLRRTQYRVADDPGPACRIARNMVFGKVYNARWSIERTRRDHSLRVDAAQLSEASAHLKGLLPQIAEETSLDSLRGLEGAGATVYFGVFDQMILGEKPLFSFHTRSRRPPMDPVNAVLWFLYSILANDCASALESVGLDAYVGFLHRDRPGRTSLALDLMEELRPCLADRFVLTLINHRTLTKQSFDIRENGVVLLSDNGRRTVLKHWQERKRLRQIARQCVNYGQRVQNSVFECLLDTAQSRLLQAKLRAIMDEEKDSLRFYYLGNRYQNKIEHFGCKPTYFPEDPLIL